MSAEATGWVWKHSPYQGAQLLVHLAIADVVNDVHGNEFWMSTASLARKARVARSTVIEALAHMTQRGYLVMVESGQDHRKPSRYRFLVDNLGNMTAHGSSTRPLDGQPLDRSAVANSSSSTQEPKGSFPQPLHSATPGDPHCVRCQGRERIFSGAGFEIDCPCTAPPVGDSVVIA